MSELKNDSATALSQQLPRRLMLGTRLLARQNRCQSSLPY
ncbi:integrase catalytic subunit (plasmid) [Escherichia coli PCN061]|nr:integrase catalytic subunit [Escherichia coli PCN061]